MTNPIRLTRVIGEAPDSTSWRENTERASAHPEKVVKAPANPMIRNILTSPENAPRLNPATSEPSELMISSVVKALRVRLAYCSANARRGAPMKAPSAIAAIVIMT